MAPQPVSAVIIFLKGQDEPLRGYFLRETDVALDADLSWTAGSDATSHDVYFGTSPSPGVGELQGNQAGTTFDPGALTASTTYYWRIDQVNAETGRPGGPGGRQHLRDDLHQLGGVAVATEGVGLHRVVDFREHQLGLEGAAGARDAALGVDDDVAVVMLTQVDFRTGARFDLAEITDAAMSQRADCVMLNKGPYIVETIQFLAGILRRMDRHQFKKTARLSALTSWRGAQPL
mgnify:CR=1 FL=1